MDRWQDEIVTTLGYPATKGEVRSLEADAVFDEISENTYFASQSAQTPAQALAIELCGYVKAVKEWSSYYENWELEQLSNSARIRFPAQA